MDVHRGLKEDSKIILSTLSIASLSEAAFVRRRRRGGGRHRHIQ